MMTWLLWSSMNVFCKTFLVSILAQYSFGFEDVKSGHMTSDRAGRGSSLTTFDHTDRDRSMDPYPTLEESLEFTKMGPGMFNTGILYNEEYDTEDFDDFLSNQPLVEKRPNVKLIPRIGRRKRSLSDEEQHMEDKITNLSDEKMSEKGVIKPDWNEETDRDYVFRTDKRRPRSKAIFIPRIGKKSYEGTDNREEKRAVFIPRIGKKSYEGTNNREEKRVVFIPRIGRGSFLSKARKYNPQYRIKGRAVFIPRIG